MKAQGDVGGIQLVVLIDNDFVSRHVVEKLVLKVMGTETVLVRLGNEIKEQSTGTCKGVMLTFVRP